MKKINLTLNEIYLLSIELEGFTDDNGNKLVVGLLNQNISMTTKYWLKKLSKIVSDIKKEGEEIKNEIIKKYGDEKDGNVSINIYIDDKNGEKIINPSYIKVNNEFNKVLQEIHEIEYREIPLSDFEDIKTSDNYEIIYKLVKE